MTAAEIHELVECFVWGFIWPLPFLFALYLARVAIRYFSAASKIDLGD